MVKRISMVVLCLGLFMAGSAAARDISFSSGLTQDDFKHLTKEAGTAMAYRNTAPAEPLGITGFDAGIEVSAVSIKKDGTNNYWQNAFNGNAPSYLYLPKIRVRKGLPFGIDIGAMYSYVPDSNIKLYGAEISKAILEGTTVTPALGIRATYTKLAGVGDLDLQTVGVDASISKGFVLVTPYAGAGAVWIDSKAKGNLLTLSPGLASEKLWQPRVFGGLKLTPLPLLGITAEVEYAARPIYSLKAAVSF
ncbi:hypothetical protein Geob_0705 [Geotalea daltonii FRC-32]|uniref:Uncharacterized protein n=1 Tax=Geotalea daltonii (strain DSM 22248 / JCM 15807 / FRC-32) TaxID=316067 RepID=B9M0N2_GEODF|nr:hypothetical protein [Geotalea daltonii]ACM19069.1 hypothetical protein Geob_0705 [Geotalea daltonii FRC-32]